MKTPDARKDAAIAARSAIIDDPVRERSPEDAASLAGLRTDEARRRAIVAAAMAERADELERGGFLQLARMLRKRIDRSVRVAGAHEALAKARAEQRHERIENRKSDPHHRSGS